MFTVIITDRNESKRLLEHTINSVSENTKGNYELIHIRDEEGKGVGPTRDRAIRQSKNDTVLLLDSHMTMESGTLDKLADFIEDHKTALACATCLRGTETDLDTANVPIAGYGASLRLLEDKNRILSRQWIRSNPRRYAKIPMILGACYGLSRSHYLWNLKAPWQYLECAGWGEVTVSLPNYLLGYDSYVLPYARALHAFRKTPPYTGRLYEQLNNQLFNLYSFVPESDWQPFIDHMQLPPNRSATYGIKNLTKRKAIDNMRANLEKNQKRTWQEYLEFNAKREEPE